MYTNILIAFNVHLSSIENPNLRKIVSTDYPDFSNNYEENDFEEGNVKYEKIEDDHRDRSQQDMPPTETEPNGRSNYEYEVQDY